MVGLPRCLSLPGLPDSATEVCVHTRRGRSGRQGRATAGAVSGVPGEAPRAFRL